MISVCTDTHTRRLDSMCIHTSPHSSACQTAGVHDCTVFFGLWFDFSPISLNKCQSDMKLLLPLHLFVLKIYLTSRVHMFVWPQMVHIHVAFTLMSLLVVLPWLCHSCMMGSDLLLCDPSVSYILQRFLSVKKNSNTLWCAEFLWAVY